jgi:hypothetical protein
VRQLLAEPAETRLARLTGKRAKFHYLPSGQSHSPPRNSRDEDRQHVAPVYPLTATDERESAQSVDHLSPTFRNVLSTSRM